MQRFHISASIFDVAPDVLHQLLKEMVGDLSFQSRMMGYQMFLESPELQLSVETMAAVHPDYTLNAHYSTDAAGAAAWAASLRQRLEAADIFYLLDYFEEDADGNEIGEELNFSHPDFDTRYADWRAKTDR